MKSKLFIALIAIFTGGCAYVPHSSKGGSASVAPAATIGQDASGAPVSTITQPENPQGTSTQSVDYKSTETVEQPIDTIKKTVTEYPDGRKVTVEEPVPAGTKTVRAVEHNVKQELGGSWYDKAKEVAVKLASYRPIQYIGVVLILAAIAMFHPLVRTAIGGGKEIQMICGAVGVAFIFGPSIIVGQEKLILFLGCAFVGVAYLLSRLQYYKGHADAKSSSTTTSDSTSTSI